LERAVALRAAPAREIPARARACSMVGAPFVAGTTRPGRGVLVGEYLWVHDGTRNVRRRRLWPKTRYHLLTTDGGIVADQPGKMAGEAAIGVVLKAPLEEISEPIGPAKDHHVAEYRALIRGLEAARSRGIGHLRVCLDSALLVNQLNGRWKVKAEHLKPLHEQAVSLIQQFADIKITWVPRKANAEADALASTPLGPLRPKPKPSIDELPLE
jgi:ribonuclease HI